MVRSPTDAGTMTANKIGFVLLSSAADPLPSTRITVLNMFAYLRDAGFDPHIVFEPQSPTEVPDVSGLAQRLVGHGFRAVFFQKVHGRSVEALARELRGAGIRTVYGVCDLVNPAMVEATDATIAVTEYLRSLYPVELQQKIRVIHDGIENPLAQKQSWSDHTGGRRQRLHAVLVTSATLTDLPVLGMPPDWLDVCIVGRYPPASARLERLREARWKLLEQPGGSRMAYAAFLLNPRIRRVQWDPAGVYDELQRADIGIIPVDTSSPSDAGADVPSWKVKSENRLTMKMAVGLPVIATPIPAYEPVLQHGWNGFFAHSRADWQRCLQALRDPALRREIGDRARRSVLLRYSKERQGAEFAGVLRALLSDQPLRAQTHAAGSPDPEDQGAALETSHPSTASAGGAPPSQGMLRTRAAS
jgi:hypothetical protein